MDFKDTRAIYLQIIDLVCEYILTGRWKESERILSVREFGMQLGVNPNTVMRAYECLQLQEIICNKRGVGFFVTADASLRIAQVHKQEFIETDLPELFRRMEVLEIPIETLIAAYEKYRQGNGS